MTQVKYKRIVLKISGEALAGSQGTGIDPTVISRLYGYASNYHEWFGSSGWSRACRCANKITDINRNETNC